MFYRIKYKIKGGLSMQMSQEDYLFYEWLILDKEFSQEEFSKLSSKQIDELHSEWKSWFNKQ